MMDGARPVAAPVTPRAPADLSLTAMGLEVGKLDGSQRQGEISLGEGATLGNHARCTGHPQNIGGALREGLLVPRAETTLSPGYGKGF